MAEIFRRAGISQATYFNWKKKCEELLPADGRQIELLDKAWKESGRVYGYRKLHDDLLDHGRGQLRQPCRPPR